jgi:hypothetical protein
MVTGHCNDMIRYHPLPMCPEWTFLAGQTGVRGIFDSRERMCR